MRVTEQVGWRNAVYYVSKSLERLAEVQVGISSGKRFSRVSGDPAAARTVIWTKSRIGELEQYKKNYFVQCYRLNLPDSEFSRTISGLDTRAVSLQGYFNTTGTLTTDPNLVLFCETTSTLRVGSMKQMEVVV